ncbi:MAG: hypothetical protein MUC91_12920 [Verrucomicrobia bacterium]|nr:hypothetical protein [Verrucomicrobiota bacterium]
MAWSGPHLSPAAGRSCSNEWVDARESFMARVLPGTVQRLLGEEDFGTAGDYWPDPMPPVNQLIGRILAWRQGDGSHELTPNGPAFFEWVPNVIADAALPAALPLDPSPAPDSFWRSAR